jgi:hemerythrin superfamily protein
VSSAPLPPLPPVFGVTNAELRPGGRSMLDVLVDDHHTLAMLYEQLAADDPATPERQPLVDVLVAVLSRHLSAEEQYLYPAVRAVLSDGDQVADRELAEDQRMLRTLRELHAMSRDDPAFPATVDAVGEQVRVHSRRASREIFPRLRELCGEGELIRLGNRVEIARAAAPSRPYPSTPATPPANKLVDPALGVLDKVRDAVTRRTTWPEDLKE